MKDKTSVNLSPSDRAHTDARDLERLNKAAEQLNLEAADVLEYQFDWNNLQ